MNRAHAFRKLGYFDVPGQNTWSATNGVGICITLWDVEIDNSLLIWRMDTRTDAGPLEGWPTAGNNRRKLHLEAAQTSYDGWLDVVRLWGVPGGKIEKAEPWIVKDRKNLRWRLTYFDEATGRFAAETAPWQ